MQVFDFMKWISDRDMLGGYHDINMPTELANRKTTTDWRTTSALQVRSAWLGCGVTGEVDEGVLFGGAGVDVGTAEKMESVRTRRS